MMPKLERTMGIFEVRRILIAALAEHANFFQDYCKSGNDEACLKTAFAALKDVIAALNIEGAKTAPLSLLLLGGKPELEAVHLLRRELEKLVASYPEEQARNSADRTRKKDPGRTDRTAAIMAFRELLLFLDKTHMPGEARRWLFALREELRDLELTGRAGPLLKRPITPGGPRLTSAAHVQNVIVTAAVRAHMDYDPEHGNKETAAKQVAIMLDQFGLRAKVRGKSGSSLAKTIENCYEEYNKGNAPDWMRDLYLHILSNVEATVKAGRPWKDCIRDLVKTLDRERAADAACEDGTKPARAGAARAPARRDPKR